MPIPQELLISERTSTPAPATPHRPVQVRATFVRLPRQSPSIDA
jgi:hypothetical protein